MNEIHEQNYQEALSSNKKDKTIKVCIMPFIIILGYLCSFTEILTDKDFINFFGASAAVLALFFLVADTLSTYVNKDCYFPQFKVGDIVIYNPTIKDNEGNYSYKYDVSTEFPELNASIPRQRVHSIGKSSLLIKDNNNEYTEIPFRSQWKILLQKNETEFKPSLPGAQTVVTTSFETRAVAERI